MSNLEIRRQWNIVADALREEHKRLRPQFGEIAVGTFYEILEIRAQIIDEYFSHGIDAVNDLITEAISVNNGRVSYVDRWSRGMVTGTSDLLIRQLDSGEMPHTKTLIEILKRTTN